MVLFDGEGKELGPVGTRYIGRSRFQQFDLVCSSRVRIQIEIHAPHGRIERKEATCNPTMPPPKKSLSRRKFQS
jgi:hypothetical protein